MTHYLLMPCYENPPVTRLPKALESISATVNRKDVKVVVLHSDSHLGGARGFTKSCKELFQIALSDESMESVTLMANDITMVTNNWLDILVEKSKKDPSIGMFCTRELLPPSYDYSLLPFSGERWGKDQTPKSEKELIYAIFTVVWISGACLRKVGLPDDKTFMTHYDDYDFGVRTWLAGFRVVWAPEVSYLHERGVTLGALIEKGVFPYPSDVPFHKKWSFLYPGMSEESAFKQLKSRAKGVIPEETILERAARERWEREKP